MAGRQCFHCKQWIEHGEEHDCWTTTEAALTEDLSEDLQEAYERLREAAVELGDQRVANFICITHRDEVEPPITDWLQEAYEWSEQKKKATKSEKPRTKKA